ASDANHMQCELGILEDHSTHIYQIPEPIFRFRKRAGGNADRFNVALIIPTGIGADIGGHAGDGTPVARLIGRLSDTLITHPNVVNASDINEMPANTLYVEGSVLSRLLMGTVGLRPVRGNRVLLVIDDNLYPTFVNAAVNAVSAARSSYGLTCPKVIKLSPPLIMRSKYTESGSAVGEIENIEYLFQVLAEDRDLYDAVAISSVIGVPKTYHQEYFDRAGEMVNPWGGVEAMLTHAVSSVFNVPSAHSPMFESAEIANKDPGIVEPRLAAEAVSVTFLQCILKGLQRSPQIVTDETQFNQPDVLTAEDVSCLVMPDGCLGLPTLAALEQGIPVIAVRENKNLMRNDLTHLPWQPGQLHIVQNYWEAAGVLACLKAGIDPASVRRPLTRTEVEQRVFATDTAKAAE
ncbi:MAG: DUF3326 domain-containing protein, partial [SAR324 cluster bacterium]|nr:DUF3326 domain-containing protein [SAR324 cluster bacterium]